MVKYDENHEPLHFATHQGLVDRVKAMLKSGVNPDIRDAHGMTPLMVAAKNGNSEIALALIHAGADLNAKDKRSAVWEGRQTPLHFACSSGRVGMAELLLGQGADPDCVSQSLDTPLSSAIARGNRMMAECLLSHGASPNGPTKCAMPPIVAAALKDDVTMINLLLKLQADPNRIGGNGALALGCTTSVDCVRALLAGGADVNLKNSKGETPLYEGLLVGDANWLELLTRHAADVNMPCNGRSPLHLLAVHSRPEIATALIDAGADVNQLDEEGRTPMDICLQMGRDNYYVERQQIAQILREKGGKLGAELNT